MVSHIKSLEKKIRGWLPKEPILPSRASASPAKQNRGKTVILNLAVSLFAAIGLLYAFSSLSDSWIKIWLIGACLVAGGLCLVSRGRLRRALKVTLVAAMIFTVSFTAVEGYLLWNGGYPATYTPTQPTVTLTLQKMLNTSVEQIVQSAEDSQTFALLKLEHGSNLVFESMNLSPSNGYLSGGYINVDFASTSSNTYYHCYSDAGHQYIIQVTTYNGEAMSQQYPSKQTVDQALKQIDALGLNWFYNQALEIAQNRTSNLPSIDSVVVTLAFGAWGPVNYQGLTMQLTGFHQTVQSDGNVNGDGVLISQFQPNGTLLYMSIQPNKS